MRISADKFEIFNGIVPGIFGISPQRIDADTSLSALIVTKCLQNGDWVSGDTAIYEHNGASSPDNIKYLFDEDGIKLSVVRCSEMFEIDENGWKLLAGAPYPVSEFLSQKNPTKVYVNFEKKRVIAIVKGYVDNIWQQLFITLFPKIFSWYYPEELSEETKAFMRAVHIKSELPDEEVTKIFVDHINKIYRGLFTRDFIIEKSLGGFENASHEKRIEEYEYRLKNLHNSISDYINSLNRLYREYDETSDILRGLKLNTSKADGELIRFLKDHKNIAIGNVEREAGRIEYHIEDTLEFFDEKEFLDLYNNKKSYLYSGIEPDGVVAKLLYAIFAERKALFRVSGEFTLSNMREVKMRDGIRYGNNVIPNPHIYYYGCGGGNNQYYREYRERGDWELGMEQSIAATKNIWFGDSAVVPKFIRCILENMDALCIQMPEGNVVSPNEFIKMLEEENG